MWIRVRDAAPVHWEKDTTNWKKKEINIPVLLSFKSPSAILRGFSNEGYVFTWHKQQSQVYLNTIMHTFFWSGFFSAFHLC